MALAIQPTQRPSIREDDGPSRISLVNISWELYERLREDQANRHLRKAYDLGDIELMSPSLKHEKLRFRFNLFIVAIARVFRFKVRGLASTTWKREGAAKAKEADGCYYFAYFERIRGKEIDLEIDPPPDLALEVEISRSSIDSLGLYAAIGIPEVWRFDGESLSIHLKTIEGQYSGSTRSLALPFLTVSDIEDWMRKADALNDDMEWMEQVEDRARQELRTRLDPQ